MASKQPKDSAGQGVKIARLDEREVEGRINELCDLLIDCVEGGASVSFMAPLERSKAADFWRGVGENVRHGHQVLLVAIDDNDTIIGCVIVVIGLPENQPHRADICKMLVKRAARRRGLGAILMAEAEAAAAAEGRTLLVLDTATPEAERLYRRAGFVPVGQIPDYALMPDGALCATTFFYKNTAENSP